jgi:hypothetical protein
MVCWPVCPGVRPQSGASDQFFFSFLLKFSLDSCEFTMGCPLWWEDGSVEYSSCRTVFLRSYFCRTHDQMLLSQIWDFPNLEGNWISQSKSKLHYDWRSVGQSVLVSGTHLGPATNLSPSLFIYLFLDSCGFVDVGRLLWREVGSVVFRFCWASPAQSFSDLSPNEHILLSPFLRLPQPGGPGSCIYFPQEQGSQVIPPSIGFE